MATGTWIGFVVRTKHSVACLFDLVHRCPNLPRLIRAKHLRRRAPNARASVGVAREAAPQLSNLPSTPSLGFPKFRVYLQQKSTEPGRPGSPPPGRAAALTPWTSPPPPAVRRLAPAAHHRRHCLGHAAAAASQHPANGGLHSTNGVRQESCQGCNGRRVCIWPRRTYLRAAPPAAKSTIGLRVRPSPRSRRCRPLQQAAGTGVQDLSGKVDSVGRPAAAGPGHRRRGFDRHYLGRARAGAQGLSPPGGAGRAYALPASGGLPSLLGPLMRARESFKNHENRSLQSLDLSRGHP
eukprot:SAG22_NODE_3538_length_1654_cov_2.008360_2_plen_294_part_00